jgi:hypothetical protein
MGSSTSVILTILKDGAVHCIAKYKIVKQPLHFILKSMGLPWNAQETLWILIHSAITRRSLNF